MKAKVLIPFTDKHTGKKHKAGDVIDITTERFEEIRSKGKLITPVDTTTAATAKKKQSKGAYEL